MDTVTQTVVLPIIAQLGVGAIFLVMLARVYNDGKAERQMMLDKLDNLESIKTRLTRMEDKLGIYDPPTLPKRPDGF